MDNGKIRKGGVRVSCNQKYGGSFISWFLINHFASFLCGNHYGEVGGLWYGSLVILVKIFIW